MKKLINASKLFLAPNAKKIALKNIKSSFETELQKEDGEILLEAIKAEMSQLQEVLFAEKKHAVWIVLQAMDAAGKDSAIEHVFSGINPQGVDVHSFKAPSANEYAHDFLWRHAQVIPEKGKIGIHNRSHYEFVLACKVHPAFNLSENLPGIQSVKDFNADFWKKRFNSIKNFEQHLADNGVTILKFYLHISKEEQKQRFLDRINEQDKNWKFNADDLKERALWDKYMESYAQVFEQTSSTDAPWYIIPADKKWFARLAIAEIITEKLKSLDMKFPTLSEAETQALQGCKSQLETEK